MENKEKHLHHQRSNSLYWKSVGYNLYKEFRFLGFEAYFKDLGEDQRVLKPQTINWGTNNLSETLNLAVSQIY